MRSLVDGHWLGTGAQGATFETIPRLETRKRSTGSQTAAGTRKVRQNAYKGSVRAVPKMRARLLRPLGA